MLARAYRLTKEVDFERVKKKGKKHSGSLFTFIVHKRQDKETSRFGIVISKKVAKLASKRNFFRRIISDAIRQSYVFVKPGYDCVILVRPTIMNKYTADIMQEIRQMLEKSDLLK